jgi:predicted O-methyltransferase YrrM
MLPDFNRDRFEGQMNPEERKLLYDTVMQYRPEICVENGTCRGGGSTYYIASALANLEELDGVKRTLHTTEMKKEFFDYALNLYSDIGALAHLRKYVEFHFGNSLNLLREFAMTFPKVDLLMLDGGHDSMVEVYDFCSIRPIIPIGGLVCFHDWQDGKTDYIRPIIKNEHDWGQIGEAIGFTVWQRTGNVHGCS